MPSSTATISTNRASSYLQQLCKHFGHKVPVEFTPETGRIDLPFGTCELRAEETSLTLTANGGSGSLERLEQVISDHLARFAFRENIALTWQRAT